ncbi:MAG: toll/interleukin-1 receptor domain-containing protein [Oscillospiraceae bacterium]|nr:toll/interleukin-1 receptor domain-containing protein [Oscillospiraceae bacterium]
MYKIFISHSSKDKAIIDIIVDGLLQNGMGIKHEDIFYTSGDSMGVKTGDEWRNAIKDSLLNAEVVLLVISPNYKESEICLNEMGAAWANCDKVIPVIVPNITFATVGVTFDVMQGIKLNDSSGLDNLRDTIHKWTSIDLLPTARWSKKKEEAICSIDDYINKNPFPLPLSRDVFEKLETENKEMEQSFKDIVAEKQKLEEIIVGLKGTKDKTEVKAIMKQYEPTCEFDEFKHLASNVSTALNNLENGVVITSIFAHVTNNNLLADNFIYGNEIQTAVSEGQIDEEQNLNVNGRKVKEALKALEEFKCFLEEFSDVRTFEDNYEDLDLNFYIKSFWEQVFKIKMSIG